MQTPLKTSRPKVPELFEVNFNDGKLTLKAFEEINDRSWGTWFGQIQYALSNSLWEKAKISHCELDLRDCLWADPLPLLSLALSMAEFRRTGGTIGLILPSWDDFNATDQNRLLKFLSKEGFIELFSRISAGIDFIPDINDRAVNEDKNDFLSYGSVRVGQTELSGRDYKRLKDLRANMAFYDSTCLPATLLFLHSPLREDAKEELDLIDRWVERCLSSIIEPVIADKLPTWAQSGLKYRLLMLLRETLHNVAEHAYGDQGAGYVAIYVRYREGLLGVAPSVWKQLYSSFSREDDHLSRVPLMYLQFAKERTGFFEIFIIDSGHGLCKTLGACSPSDECNLLHQAFLDVLIRGKRRGKQTKSSQYGGLNLVADLLSSNRDYMRARDCDHWVGAPLPFPEKAGDIRHALICAGKHFTGYSVRGLAWTVRLSWQEKTDIPGHKQPWLSIGNEAKAAPIYEVLAKGSSDYGLIVGIPVQDKRFIGWDWNNLSVTKSSTLIVLLPRTGWMKGRIEDEIAQAITSVSLKKEGTFLIGDIRSEEAATYLAAIDQAFRFTKAPLNQIGRIVLVTRELRVCVLSRINGKLTIDQNASKNYIELKNPSNTRPESNLLHYLRLLRQHDTRRIAEAFGLLGTNTDLNDNSFSQVFVNEPVAWNDRTLSSGYLDFPQTLTHPICREIYSVALQRLTSLYPQNHCELTPLDPLVDSLLVRFNAQQHPRPVRRKGVIGIADTRQISVGSVLVSGLTEASAINTSPVFHFFAHPDGKHDGMFLLLWPLSLPIGQQTLPLNYTLPPGSYRRVGHTSVIARDGWKAYRLPRFLNRPNRDEQLSIYEQSPRNSYRVWQDPSRTPMKLGHWRYSGHHDFLTLNLLLAFDTELDKVSMKVGGALARFLFHNLFRIFNVIKEDLTEDGQELWNTILTDNYHHLLPDFTNQDPLLIYPSHVVTDHVMDRFFTLLSGPALKKVRNRTLAILPVRRHRTGSGLQLSGLTLERLEIESKYANRPVVLFDDAVVTGRTHQELKRLLRTKGYNNIHTLTILDRQRLPSADYLENKPNVCYWRLDIPPMGSDAHCPLCSAIDKARDFADALTSPWHKERVNSWCSTWSPRNPATEWGDGGLKPIPLDLKKADHRFSIFPDALKAGVYYQCGGDNQKIRISNSAGLAAWVAEIHSMTSRDDLATTKVIKEEVISPEASIQLIASQLLIFAGEFDSSLEGALAYQLLKALWDIEQNDRHSALAVLTLLAINPKSLNFALNSLLNTENNDNRAMLDSRCPDFHLLVAAAIRYGYISDQSDLERAGRLLQANNRAGMYFNLHREIKDVQGKYHRTPLHRFIKPEEASIVKNHIPDVLDSIAQIKTLTRQISPSWFRSPQQYIDFRLVDKVAKSTKSLQLELEKLGSLIKTDDNTVRKAEDSFSRAKKAAQELLVDAESFHENIFAPLGLTGMKKGDVCLINNKLVDLCNEHYCSEIRWVTPSRYSNEKQSEAVKKSNLDEAFIVWDRDVLSALAELMKNLRHGKGQVVQIPDKWGKDQGLAATWGRTILDEKCIWIEFANHRNKSARAIEAEMNEKPYLLAIQEVNCIVKYEETKQGHLITRLSLPYAHTLRPAST